MSTTPDSHHPAPHLNNGEKRHESGDGNIRIIVLTGVLLAVSTGLVALAAWGIFVLFRHRDAGPTPGASPLAVQEGNQPFEKRLEEMPKDQPRLEGLRLHEGENPFVVPGRPRYEGHSPPVRPKELKPSEQPTLQDYGRALPPEEGYVSIPLKEAFTLILDKKLLPAEEAKQGTTDRIIPSSSNSGRGLTRAKE